MKTRKLSKGIQGVIALTLGAAIATYIWIWRAPYVECFVNEGGCVYYVQRNSDFFVADFLYALLMFALGVIVGVLYQRAWWQSGILFQVGLAAFGTLLSILVALSGQLVRPLSMINDLKADAGLELRTLGAIFILPSVVQVIITITGTAYGNDAKQDESEA